MLKRLEKRATGRSSYRRANRTVEETGMMQVDAAANRGHMGPLYLRQPVRPCAPSSARLWNPAAKHLSGTEESPYACNDRECESRLVVVYPSPLWHRRLALCSCTPRQGSWILGSTLKKVHKLLLDLKISRDTMHPQRGCPLDRLSSRPRLDHRYQKPGSTLIF